ncbi:hypothetical protein NLU13_4516 [Sarocladium strictum]|uniref:Uncharacterized protein n=1 Tax=Sarocladium strictum TaxID=5046 RepID=A0AA39GJN5_SARSR|nr:hypothetical protein NLU13_4516 [Sarocladium strictum]
MTSLPSQHPTLSLHLTDQTLHPIITSSSSNAHLNSLTVLTNSALTAQTAVQRAGLGRPQRIMVEYPDRGPVVLQSYLESPPSGAPTTSTGAASTSTTATTTTTTGEAEDGATAGKIEEPAPMLVGVVVAGSADEVREARRAAGRLERVGREFQKEWAAERDSSHLTTD